MRAEPAAPERWPSDAGFGLMRTGQVGYAYNKMPNPALQKKL